jgi:hypothetical protein
MQQVFHGPQRTACGNNASLQIRRVRPEMLAGLMTAAVIRDRQQRVNGGQPWPFLGAGIAFPHSVPVGRRIRGESQVNKEPLACVPLGIRKAAGLYAE